MKSKTQGSAHFAINDISMDWDETERRSERPCAKCGELTKGRMRNVGGVKTPAHMTCAMQLITEKALTVYGRRHA